MKAWIGILGLAVLAAGCHHDVVLTDKDGNKLSIDTSPGGQGKFSVTDDKGKTVTSEVDPNGKGMTVKDNQGNSFSINANAVTESDLGVPFYPGAKMAEGSLKSGSAKETFMMCSFTSSDEPAKVVAFYKDKVKEGKDSNMTIDGSATSTLSGKRADGAEFNVMASKAKGQSQTTITMTVGKKN